SSSWLIPVPSSRSTCSTVSRVPLKTGLPIITPFRSSIRSCHFSAMKWLLLGSAFGRCLVLQPLPGRLLLGDRVMPGVHPLSLKVPPSHNQGYSSLGRCGSLPRSLVHLKRIDRVVSSTGRVSSALDGQSLERLRVLPVLGG